MRYDLAQLSTPARSYDVCIVGSGPAGLSLARELAGKGLRLCVLESGRLEPTARGDRLRQVECAGIEIKPWSRERVFGGASTTWAGLSSPLDAIDFESRAWVPHSGWPIHAQDLALGYQRAAEVYRFATVEQLSVSGGLSKLRARGDWQPSWQQLEEKLFLAAAPAQNFATEQGAIFDRDDCDLYYDASVLRLEAERSTARVARAIVRASSGVELALEADRFVLATGGIENARLLLVSQDLCPAGLGNEHDQVGRYLMNHPKNYYGRVLFREPVRSLPYFFGCMAEGYSGYAGLRLVESEQRAQGVLNSYVRLEPLFPWTDSRGVEALVTLAKQSRWMMGRVQAQGRRGVVELRDYAETGDDSELQNQRSGLGRSLSLMGHVLGDFPRVTRYALSRLRSGRKPRVAAARLRNFMEMQPHPENRVTLSRTLDEHGVPLPHVRHTVSELDRRSLIELHARLAQELNAMGSARLESDLAQAQPWPIDADASHHMGTTRMGKDPATSVVNAQLRVHSVRNLYIAGASVFPTSGCANPTYTIVALSVRLAQHLIAEGQRR